jgi:hypothetical protein
MGLGEALRKPSYWVRFLQVSLYAADSTALTKCAFRAAASNDHLVPGHVMQLVFGIVAFACVAEWADYSRFGYMVSVLGSGLAVLGSGLQPKRGWACLHPIATAAAQHKKGRVWQHLWGAQA